MSPLRIEAFKNGNWQPRETVQPGDFRVLRCINKDNKGVAILVQCAADNSKTIIIEFPATFDYSDETVRGLLKIGTKFHGFKDQYELTDLNPSYDYNEQFENTSESREIRITHIK